MGSRPSFEIFVNASGRVMIDFSSDVADSARALVANRLKPKMRRLEKLKISEIEVFKAEVANECSCLVSTGEVYFSMGAWRADDFPEEDDEVGAAWVPRDAFLNRD